jgi:hypothetical protein
MDYAIYHPIGSLIMQLANACLVKQHERSYLTYAVTEALAGPALISNFSSSG